MLKVLRKQRIKAASGRSILGYKAAKFWKVYQGTERHPAVPTKAGENINKTMEINN